MDPDYALRYKWLYQSHWWWRARERLILDALARNGAARGGTVLDIGCGDGVFFDRLAAFGSVEGIETDERIVTDDGPHRNRIHVGPLDGFRTEKRYSLILMLDVIEHIEDDQTALAHALSLLEPDGVLIVTVPAFPSLWTRHDELNHHYRRYTKASWRRLADTAGMEIRSWRYSFHFLCALKLLVRAAETVLPSPPSTPSVPTRPLNGLLYGLARLEQNAAAARLPFGSSLLVVGGRAPGCAPATP